MISILMRSDPMLSLPYQKTFQHSLLFIKSDQNAIITSSWLEIEIEIEISSAVNLQ